MTPLSLFHLGNDPAAGAHVANALRAGNFQHTQPAAAERSGPAGGARYASEGGAFRVAGTSRAALRLDEHHVRRRSHLCLQGGEQPRRPHLLLAARARCAARCVVLAAEILFGNG